MIDPGDRPWESGYIQTMKSKNIPKISLYRMLSNTVKRFGDRAAIYYEEQMITYAKCGWTYSCLL
ncbi:hypothetical protein ABEY41_12595 [Peribacillus butanolivorans]|uniref:hypothetical protein n=1 Tax=Peribacillus butanolivorans TaxID=421767 RepID=UPI003D2C3536